MAGFAGFGNLYSYHNKSNKSLLLFIMDNPQPRAINVFAHIMAADRMWLSRLELGLRAPDPQLWPNDKTTDILASELEDVSGHWARYLTQSDDDNERIVEYLNIKGEPTTRPAHQILTSCLLHATYHRGQIALLCGGESQAPPTDYIFFSMDGE
jgi:uncharacterized damage-inducible protein DinB